MDLSATQRSEILAALPDAGWRLAARQLAEAWWIDELWELESVWSPGGRTACLAFLVDPQWDGPRRFGEAVWAVACSNRLPERWTDFDSAEVVPIRPRWERDRNDVWALLRRLHDT